MSQNYGTKVMGVPSTISPYRGWYWYKPESQTRQNSATPAREKASLARVYRGGGVIVSHNGHILKPERKSFQRNAYSRKLTAVSTCIMGKPLIIEQKRGNATAQFRVPFGSFLALFNELIRRKAGNVRFF